MGHLILFDKPGTVIYCDRLLLCDLHDGNYVIYTMKTVQNLGAAVLSGVMTLGACGGSQQEPQTLAQETDSKTLVVHPPKTETPDEKAKVDVAKPYLTPPENTGEFMDVLVICLATREATKAFVQTEAQIRSTKGCRIVQAVYAQGEEVVEACTPVIESKLPLNMALMESINMLRFEIDSLQKQMKGLKILNAHCFEKEDSKLPTFYPADFTGAGRGHF